MNVLILLSESYPYQGDGDAVFLNPEVPYLCEAFDVVYIFPRNRGGPCLSLPRNCRVHPELARAIRRLRRGGFVASRRYMRALFSDEFRKEIPRIRSLSGLVKAVYYIAKAEATREVLQAFIDAQGWDESCVCLYSYWFDACAYGMTKVRGRIKTVTRAHGADLYRERHANGYIPLRERTLERIDAVCLASESSLNYLSRHYSGHVWKYHLFPLGMEDRRNSSPAAPGVGSYIVSCSHAIPLKRVDLIIEAVSSIPSSRLAGLRWVHFGDGPELPRLKEEARKKLPEGSYAFTGAAGNEDILDFYASHDVACFVTTSSTEGGRPVSIQEAQCFGIPAIGTDVGGIPELLRDGGGVLLPADPAPAEVASAILSILDSEDPEGARRSARQAWERNSDAKKNSREFARFLISLCTS